MTQWGKVISAQNEERSYVAPLVKHGPGRKKQRKKILDLKSRIPDFYSRRAEITASGTINCAVVPNPTIGIKARLPNRDPKQPPMRSEEYSSVMIFL